MNFGEKKSEYSAKHGGEIPVWQSPKYVEAKRKAVEIIESKKYDLCEADFWILMNVTKSGKMAYTGLIASHNACLKINDKLTSKFNPDCVTYDKQGYNGSLVFTYCNADQGIYEVGEVSSSNCKNDYPYAMAFKRLFDRVVLKLSKLAYSGVYSDSESDEFTQRLEAAQDVQSAIEGSYTRKPAKAPEAATNGAQMKVTSDGEFVPTCAGCNAVISDKVHDYSVKKFGRPLCMECQRKQ